MTQWGSITLKEMQRDGRDLYHKYIKWIVVPALLAYLCFSLWNEHIASVVEEGVNGTIVMTIARDSLLKMTYVKLKEKEMERNER